MIANFPSYLQDSVYVFLSAIATVIGAGGLYVILFYLLRSYFRRLERDVALVTLSVSAYPVLSLFILIGLQITIQNSLMLGSIVWLQRLLLGCIIVAASYGILQLFQKVLIYYLTEYAETTEVMWDQVLLPLLEAVVPVLVVVVSGAAILQLCLGVDLTGAWVTLGGSAFIIGFAVKDILANFFSGIALLIDSPFRFGDVLRIESNGDDPGYLGMLRKIGVRVTHIYMFELHTEVYIPNSVMQSHKIINLSRPIEPVYFSTPIRLDPSCDLDRAKQTMEDILSAHPDTLGNIERKLASLQKYYSWGERFARKKENGIRRLVAEKEVNQKLEEVEDALRAVTVTLEFVEQDGLSPEEIETIQAEYCHIMELIGLHSVPQQATQRRWLSLQRIQPTFTLEETRNRESLIQLVRHWYRIWLQDPDMAYEDEYVLPEIWERKIELLKKRTSRLYQKIQNPHMEETRLDDYVQELVRWLKNRFKQARSTWHEPDVRMAKVVTEMGYSYLQFTINYYVDDIRLEDGERGIRVNSEIHQEIVHHLKDSLSVRD